jgi:hypothetical protein
MVEARNEYGVIRTRSEGRKPRLRLARRQEELNPRHPGGAARLRRPPYGLSNAEVRERRVGRIADFLRRYAEAPRS